MSDIRTLCYREAIDGALQLAQHQTAGNATRLAVQGVAIGASFIPVVGWGFRLGLELPMQFREMIFITG
jgi:hypothetical protein